MRETTKYSISALLLFFITLALAGLFTPQFSMADKIADGSSGESVDGSSDKINEPKKSWAGVDETVVGKFAAAYGRKPVASLINTDQGDLLLFVFLLGGALGGFTCGYYWRVLIEGGGSKNGTKTDTGRMENMKSTKNMKNMKKAYAVHADTNKSL